jgi:hypothetical protein
MKKVLLLIFSLFTCSSALAHVTMSKTFFSIIPPCRFDAPEHSLIFSNPLHCMPPESRWIEPCKDRWWWSNTYGGTLQATVFGGQSRQSEDLARYFLPFNKTQIIVGEFGSQAVLNKTADAIANYFGVLSTNPLSGGTPIPPPPAPPNTSLDTTNLTFQSTISFKPHHAYAGVGFQYQHYLCRRDDGSGFWFNISFPLMWVKNKLHFCEVITNPGGSGTPEVPTGYVGSIRAALQGCTVFGNKQFRFGKLAPCGGKSKVGVADVQVTLGCMRVQHENCFLQYFFGATFPTGNKPDACLIFEPIVGNNRHFGIYGGTHSGFSFAHNEKGEIWLYSMFYGQFLFPNTQTRSFDLIGKPWSRYIWMYPNSNAVAFSDISPGINFLTFPVKVHPIFSGSATITTAYYRSCYTLQAGYRFLGKSNEQIKFAGGFNPSFGIAGLDFDDVSNTGAGKNGKGNTQTQAAINLFADALNDETVDGLPAFIPVRTDQIDLESGAHPCIITHTVFATMGFMHDICGTTIYNTLGGSYEFSGDNAVLNRWMVWASAGLSF